jgi:hypothetical protein
MVATTAELGYGVLLKMRTSTGPDVYTTLGNQRDVTPPGGFSIDIVDATHNDSPNATEEVIPGIARTPEITFQIEYNPVSATTALIEAAQRVLKRFRSVWPDGRYVQFDGYITNFEPEAPTEDKQMASVTIKRSGVHTPVAATAPTNSVLPAISGLLTNGSLLTAYEGVWNNEPTSFTYQWKNAGVNIAGATAKTYTIVAGDSGDALTVVVTGINGAGSASATSAPVIAA